MKVSARDLLELVGLCLVVLTLWEATHKAWPTIGVGSLAVLYLSHFWVIRAEVTVPKVHVPELGVRRAIRRARRRWRKR